MNWTEEIPNLSIQRLDNGNLRLEDKSFSEGAIVDVHPSQLRLMAERLGLIKETSESEVELLRQQSQKFDALRIELARLVDWLAIIETRAEQLHENVMGVAVNDHDDVNIEVAQSAALADITEQVLSDARAVLARSLASVAPDPGAQPEVLPLHKAVGSVGVKVPQVRGSSLVCAHSAQQPALL